TVNDDLRRLVEYFPNFLDAQGLFLHHRTDHDACRCGTDGPGELDFDLVHELGIGDECVGWPSQAPGGRIPVKDAVCRACSKKAREHRVEIGHGSGPAPESRSARSTGVTKYIDEQTGLTVLVSAWRHQERPGDVGAHVGNHAPDHGVADLIEPGKTKQLQ